MHNKLLHLDQNKSDRQVASLYVSEFRESEASDTILPMQKLRLADQKGAAKEVCAVGWRKSAFIDHF